MEMADPSKYRGELGNVHQSGWKESQKVFIVNNFVEKIDGDFIEQFIVSPIEKTGVYCGSFPNSQQDVGQLKLNKITAVINLMTDQEMKDRAYDW